MPLVGIRELAEQYYEPLILLQSEIYGDRQTLMPAINQHSLPVRGCLHALQVRLDPEVCDHLAVLLPEGPDGLPPAVVVEDELVGGVEHGQHVKDPLGHLGDESLADLTRPGQIGALWRSEVQLKTLHPYAIKKQ